MSQSDVWGSFGLRTNTQESWTFLCPKVCWVRGTLGPGGAGGGGGITETVLVYWLAVASSLAIHFPSLDGHM